MRILLLSLLLFSHCASADIYKWTDESGRVHYGDRTDVNRPADSVEVEVKITSYKDVTFESLSTKEPTPTSSDIAKAPSTGKVIMYATSWCPYCAKAREYFKANNIRYTEYDIEKNKSAKRKYDALNGKGVPVILVGNERMNGFSVSGFENRFK